MQLNPYSDEKFDKLEHEQVLSDIRLILGTQHGKRFFKYLFKHFGVSELPPAGLDENLLKDMMGFFRAGGSIFDLAAQADSINAGLILAEIQKEKYDVTKMG
jgi:hypothetical protein